MLELYKKVNKSIEYPRGAKKIEDGENPFEEGPCFLCFSAQDGFERSVFGFTKVATSMARVRVSDDEGARIPLDEIPVSFLSIKKNGESEEKNINDFVENYIDPLLLDENGLAKNKDKIAKSLRNVNIVSNCNGNERVTLIINRIEKSLQELKYSANDIEEILSQIALISFQTEIDLSNCKATIVDFHNLNDIEVDVNPNNISDEMIAKNQESKTGESVEKVGNRIEVLTDGEESHEVRDYIENGEAMPAIVYSIVTSVVENSIANYQSNDKHIPLSSEQLFRIAQGVLERINNGERKEEIIQEIDKSLNYGEISRLTDRELKLLAEQEKTIEKYEQTERDLEYKKSQSSKYEKTIKNVRKVAQESCTESTYLRILKASGYQLGKEQIEALEAQPKTDKETIEEDKKTIKTDKETIESGKKIIEEDKETIESQNAKINKLHGMLKRTLQFADDVRNSVFGKIFFKKAIKGLPEGEEHEI